MSLCSRGETWWLSPVSWSLTGSGWRGRHAAQWWDMALWLRQRVMVWLKHDAYQPVSCVTLTFWATDSDREHRCLISVLRETAATRTYMFIFPLCQGEEGDDWRCPARTIRLLCVVCKRDAVHLWWLWPPGLHQRREWQMPESVMFIRIYDFVMSVQFKWWILIPWN